MALASLGRLGQRGILGQSWILDRLGQCGILSSGWTGMDTRDNRRCPGWAGTHWDNLDVDGSPWAMPWLARVIHVIDICILVVEAKKLKKKL